MGAECSETKVRVIEDEYPKWNVVEVRVMERKI